MPAAREALSPRLPNGRTRGKSCAIILHSTFPAFRELRVPHKCTVGSADPEVLLSLVSDITASDVSSNSPFTELVKAQGGHATAESGIPALSSEYIQSGSGFWQTHVPRLMFSRRKVRIIALDRGRTVFMWGNVLH